jgi:hypothetical protein
VAHIVDFESSHENRKANTEFFYGGYGPTVLAVGLNASVTRNALAATLGLLARSGLPGTNLVMTRADYFRIMPTIHPEQVQIA